MLFGILEGSGEHVALKTKLEARDGARRLADDGNEMLPQLRKWPASFTFRGWCDCEQDSPQSMLCLPKSTCQPGSAAGGEEKCPRRGRRFSTGQRRPQGRESLCIDDSPSEHRCQQNRRCTSTARSTEAVRAQKTAAPDDALGVLCGVAPCQTVAHQRVSTATVRTGMPLGLHTHLRKSKLVLHEMGQPLGLHCLALELSENLVKKLAILTPLVSIRFANTAEFMVYFSPTSAMTMMSIKGRVL